MDEHGWQGRDGATHTYLGAYAVDWVFVHAATRRLEIMVEPNLKKARRWFPGYVEHLRALVEIVGTRPPEDFLLRWKNGERPRRSVIQITGCYKLVLLQELWSSELVEQDELQHFQHLWGCPHGPMGPS